MRVESEQLLRACRFCHTELTQSVVDLGVSPLCQKHVTPEMVNQKENFYPLHAFVCNDCWLMQLEEFATPEDIFDQEYGYFSSYSESWLNHAKQYVNEMIERFGFDRRHQVIEIASNDGYLLRWFLERSIPVLGIEPANNVAQAARDKGITTESKFFGLQTARQLIREYPPADLLIGNNVLAHVPDIKDFVQGLPVMLSQSGIITMEFPHLMRLIEENQFDTIYHEHYSYLSFNTVNRIFRTFGLTLFDVQELNTHGGSLRIFARKAKNDTYPIKDAVNELLERENQLGLTSAGYFQGFANKVTETKRKLLSFLISAKEAGKSIVGYGAPGKGNTLLNYCGIRTDFLDYTVDRSPHKQGNFLPGSRIPVYHPDRIKETKPDYVLILPWNLKEEISHQMKHIESWGGKFLVPIPEVRVFQTDQL